MNPGMPMLLSAGWLFCLGVVHLALTSLGKLDPRDPELRVRMAQVSPAMLKRSDMWRCWIGFNASHSMALMLFGAVYGFLAARHGPLLFGSPFLLAIGLATLAAFVVLGTAYWFRRPPYIALGIPFAAYVASLLLAVV